MDKKDNKVLFPQKRLVNILVKILLSLLLGVMMLYFLFHNTDFSQMWSIIKNANWYILFFSLIFGLLGNTFRAFRWELMIKPLGYKPQKRNLIYAIYGSYAINYVIPRGGELWRCGIIAREEKIPFRKLLGTLIIDRVLDSFLVLLLTFIIFLVNMQPFIDYMNDNRDDFNAVIDILSSPYFYLIIVLLTIFSVIIYKCFGHSFFLKKTKNFIIGFWSDLRTIWQMKQKMLLIFHSFMIWGCYFLFFYITFYAFDFTKHLGIMVGLLAFVLSSISLAIPTNGGLGPWHVAVITSLLLYGVLKNEANAFAFAVFTLQSLWTILCGVWDVCLIYENKD